MTITATDSLAIQGVLQAKASYPLYTRMTTPLNLPARYVEFLTSSVMLPQPPLPPSAKQVYVSVDTALYFSDYVTPNPAATIPGAGLRFVPPPVASPSGVVLLDGSPVVRKFAPGENAVCGLSGTDKGGDSYELALTASNAEIAGRTPGLSNWVFCHAQLTVANGPALVMGAGYSPADLLGTFFASYQNIRCVMKVDFAPMAGTNGYAELVREVTYYGETVSTVLVHMPAGAGAPMRLPTSPIHQFVLPIVTLSPALAYVVGPLEKQPQPEPLSALGTLDVQLSDSQSSFVNRGTALIGPALAALLAEIGQSAYPGFCDLAQWLGWSLTEFGKPNVEAALTSTYLAYEQWRAKQGGGSPSRPWRSVLDSGGGFAAQAIDKLFNP